MSGMKISVKASLAGAEKLLRAARERARKPRLLMMWATSKVAEAFKENFMALNAKRSKYGHNFYRNEGKAKTTTEVSPDGKTGAVVVASPQMAHKLRGGTVTAKKKFLAIPVSDWAKSQKRNPAQIPGLDVFLTRNGRAFLGRERADGDARDLDYILVRSVTHKPHPEVIPSDSSLAAAVAAACAQYERAVAASA